MDDEIVQLKGEMHNLYHATVDSNGGFHVKFHFNPQGVTGIGLDGTCYQGTGVTQGTTTTSIQGGETYTVINNFRLVSHGPGANYMAHANTHITMNPNGTITSSHNNVRITCT